MDKVRFYACLTCAKEFNQYSKFSFANIKVFIEACFNYPKNILPVEIIMYECSDYEEEFGDWDAYDDHACDEEFTSESDIYECSDCEEEFDDQDEYEEHIDENRFYACLTCAKEFNQFKSLKKHCIDVMHRLPPLVPETKAGKLQMYLQEAFYNEKVVVTRTDRKASRIIVHELIQIIMHNIVSQRGGQLYSKKLHSAGSTATQTKIGKADEYDYNIVLNDNVYIGSDEVDHPYDRTRKYKFKV